MSVQHVQSSSNQSSQQTGNVSEGTVQANATNPTKYPQLDNQTESTINSVLYYIKNMPLPSEVKERSENWGVLPPSYLLMTLGSKQAVENFGKFLEDAKQKKVVFKSWEDFETSYYSSPFSANVPPNALYEGLVRDFAAFSNIQLDNNLNIVGAGDWRFVKTTPPLNLKDPKSPNNPFITFFNSNVQELVTSRLGSFADVLPESNLDFINRLHYKANNWSLLTYMNWNGSAPPNQADSYKAYFQARFPHKDVSEEDFEKAFTDFYNAQIKKYGYFAPNPALAEWSDFLLKNAGGISFPILDEDVKRDISVLMELMRLIIQMITSLERVATVQSQSIQIQSQTIASYTTRKTLVPIFKSGDNAFWGRATSEAQKFRDNLNSITAGNWSEKNKAFSGVEEDLLKKAQALLSKLTNEVNSQTDIVKTLLDLLRSIVKTILSKQ